MKTFKSLLLGAVSFILGTVIATCVLSNCANSKSGNFSASLKEGDGSAKVALCVYISVEPDKREAFMKEMLTQLEASQKEPGTLEYTLWPDLKDPNTFLLYEEYKDKAAFAAHEANESFKHFAKRIGEIGGIKLRVKNMDVESATHSSPKK